MESTLREALHALLPYSQALIRLSADARGITLSGEVEWRYQKERAETALRALPALGHLRNLIAIRAPVDAAAVRERMRQDRRRQPGSVRAWAERRGASCEVQDIVPPAH
ncbi:MAG: BON domain-containing protein [Usitatibacter sp.]